METNSPEAERDVALSRKSAPFRRWKNKYSSSYQSEENNNPGLDLSSPINDRDNYARIVRQANRITVRFSLWLGCHPPPHYYFASWLILSFSLSITLPSPFTARLVSSSRLSHLALTFFFHPSFLLSISFSGLMNLKLPGIVSPGETSSLFGRLIFCSTMSSYSGQPGSGGWREHSCPSLFPGSLLTLLLPLN